MANILFLAHRFPPSIGGLQKTIHRLAKGLASRGHNIKIYTSTYPHDNLTIKEDGFTVFRHDPLSRSIQHFIQWPLSITPGLLDAIKKDHCSDIDIVHAFGGGGHFVTVVGAITKLLRKKTFAINVLFEPHLKYKQFNIRYEGILKKARRFTYYQILGFPIEKNADLIFVTTHNFKNILVGRGYESKKIRVIPRGINVKDYSSLPNPLDFRSKYGISKEKVIIFVGNVGFNKGAVHLVMAMKRILKEIKNVKLVFVGKDPISTRRLVEKYASPEIKGAIGVVGPFRGSDLVSAYSSADVFTLPSQSENFGNVILEAAACGLPLVCTRTGIAPDLISDGKNGLFVDFGNVTELSNALVRILMDENFKRESFNKRENILKTYNAEKEIMSYDEAYKTLLR